MCCLLSASCLLPLIITAAADYGMARRTVERNERLRTERLASNAKRSIGHFLQERLDALAFTAHNVGIESLKSQSQMNDVLSLLKQDFGGFTDIGLVDESARQIAYAGPYDLIGLEYGDQEWFTRCRAQGTFISEVYRGHRDEPHMVIAVRTSAPDGTCYALRAALETSRLIGTLAPYATGEGDDVFLMSRSAGVVQTPSRRYGDVLERALLEVPPYSEHTESFNSVDPQGTQVSVGYAYLTTEASGTPFVLVLSRPKTDTVEFLSQLRRNRVLVVGLSSFFIILVITVTSSFMFNRLYDADRVKGGVLLSMQETSRLASLGRLSTGVAHEINNPLAVINESAGYIKDLLTMERHGGYHDELVEQVDAILDSVQRCGAITTGLLGFAREMNLHLKPVRPEDLIDRVLSFHRKEAEYRRISVNLDVAEDVPSIVSDPGRLQQVFLNLIGNAFQAMDTGDSLTITVRNQEPDRVRVDVSDTGCGIPREYLQRVFEPFFTTKVERQGTGLGLSITYNLIRKLGGEIKVKSKVGEGTTFTVVLPVARGEEDVDEGVAG
jgi:signal transduction histidine kinase